MDENGNARVLEEQAAETRRRWEFCHGHRRDDWPDPLKEPYEPTQHELDLLHSQVPGHRWSAWRCLTGDENYFAACSCGWRSTETGSALQRRLERAKELRKGIASAASAMAVVAEEITWIHQDLETRHERQLTGSIGERLMQSAEEKSSSGKAHGK